MIECKNISKKFRKDFWAKEFVALENISFKLSPGKVVGFLGANGAGKTTLIKILLGFIKPNSGSVNLLDVDWSHESVKRKIGYMPERPFYYQNLTGYDFLVFCADLQDMPRKEMDTAIQKWATKLNISFALDRTIKSYSKGMLQRLGFVSALLHSPQLIILDEPLSGLDPIGRREFKEVIKEVNNEGVGIFFSSHIVSDVEEVSDDVVVLEGGRIIYNGSINELISQHTQDEYEIVYHNGLAEESIKLSTKYKDNKIQEILNTGMKIVKVQKSVTTLEEIVYRLNK